MAANFALFRQEPDGSERYIGEASSWSSALLQAELASLRSAAKYVIHDERIGLRVIVDLGPHQGASSKTLDHHAQKL